MVQSQKRFMNKMILYYWIVLSFMLLLLSNSLLAQTAEFTPQYAIIDEQLEWIPPATAAPQRKLYQRNTGVIIGLQRGRYTSIEIGGEAHWRKISLLKPRITGANLNLEYNFANNVIGYRAGAWMKRGHINLTYGAQVGYFTNFQNGHRFAIGPAVGFRLLGFHLINGFNFLTADKTSANEKPVGVNSLYMSLRYYFPVENKFIWDRQTRKRIKERQKAREARKVERKKRRASGEGGILNIFKKKN